MTAFTDRLLGRLAAFLMPTRWSLRNQALRYLDGKLSAEEVGVLNERLRQSRQARKEFARVLIGVVQARR